MVGVFFLNTVYNRSREHQLVMQLLLLSLIMRPSLWGRTKCCNPSVCPSVPYLRFSWSHGNSGNI